MGTEDTEKQPAVEAKEIDSEELTDEEAEFLGEDGEKVSDVGDKEEISTPIFRDDNSIAVPSGRAFFLKDVISITSKNRHKIIMLAGAPGSGKTSLVSDIFISFQNGEFENLGFVDSETLVGFEMKCWTTRTSSMRQLPQTPRTSIGEPAYLHLKIRDKNKGANSDLLLCDISGEKFERAVNSDAGCREINDVDWVDHFVLILDGEKLGDKVERNFSFTQSKQLLLRLIDSKKLKSNTLIQIVISKADLLDTTVIQNQEFLEEIKKNLAQELRSRDMRATFYDTSAHNVYGSIEEPFDLQKLISVWSRNSPVVKSEIEERKVDTGTREINKFFQREMVNLNS